MFIIAGLGNPGQQYRNTRHNVGFILLDYLAEKHKLILTPSKWQALTVKTLIWNVPVLLLKPETFMNSSGNAVAAAAHYYHLPPEKILVVHDDLDIEFSRLKLVAGGGDGGHKGIKSIIEHLGTKDFPRLKIGIGRPKLPIPPEKYVLGKFDPEEKQIIAQKMAGAAEGIRVFLQAGISAAMSILNRKE